MTTLPTSTTTTSPTISHDHSGVTPEQLARNMGGMIQFYKHYTVAWLRSPEDVELFKRWLDQHDHELVHFNNDLTIAYRAPRPSTTILLKDPI